MKKLYFIYSIQTTLIAILAGIALIFQSCEKDKETETNHEQTEILFFEQGFPDNDGIITTVELDGIEVECEKIDNLFVYQGDIIINTTKNKSTDGAGISSTQKRWPNKIIYYVITSNMPDKGRFTDAINHWTNNTSLIFVERQNEPNYIEFVWDQSGCWSYLGMIGGRQEIHIADWGTAGTIIHEIGHAVGLIHEQSKPNRDDEVIIKWDNIKVGKSNNFRIHTNSVYIEYFDFNSIMLYSSYAFTKNSNPTITKKDGSTYTAQRNNLSLDDIQIVEDMYAESVCGQANLTYGGQTYKIIEIGNQCWMAENLNYETPNSYWYDNSSANGDIYGRLYTWEAALTVCPNGWHLPSDDEWKTLEMALGMSQSEADNTGYRGTDEGEKMKSTSGWDNNDNGTNTSGFNGLPAGQGGPIPVGIYFSDLSYVCKYWSSNEYSKPPYIEHAWHRHLYSYTNQVYRYFLLKESYISVRCVKD